MFYSVTSSIVSEHRKHLLNLEPKPGFEPGTSSLPRMRSTPELLGQFRSKTYGAGDEIRTRDIQLGRLTLYQLSYSRPLRPGITRFELVHGVGFEPT